MMTLRATRAILAVMTLLLGAALAQTTPPGQTPAKSTGAAAKPPAAPAKTPARSPFKAPPATAAKAPMAKPAAKATTAKKPVAKATTAKKPAAKESEAAAKPVAARSANKRDPFLSPVVTGRGGVPACSTGKRCLTIEQVVLKGTIKSREGMLALVENAAQRAYVLRENDAVFNGVVVKITGDSVIFRESVLDSLGHESQREVVKRVTAPAV